MYVCMYTTIPLLLLNKSDSVAKRLRMLFECPVAMCVCINGLLVDFWVLSLITPLLMWGYGGVTRGGLGHTHTYMGL